MNHPPLLGLRHIALKVKDMSKMRHFYVNVLGFRIEWEPDPQNLYLTSGTDNLALHRVDEEIGQGSLDHLGILVEQAGDVDAWSEYLKANNITLKQEAKTHRDGARSIYFTDPEENLIQLIYHPPISGK